MAKVFSEQIFIAKAILLQAVEDDLKQNETVSKVSGLDLHFDQLILEVVVHTLASEIKIVGIKK